MSGRVNAGDTRALRFAQRVQSDARAAVWKAKTAVSASKPPTGDYIVFRMNK